MAQEQSLPEDYNTEFDPEAFLKNFMSKLLLKRMRTQMGIRTRTLTSPKQSAGKSRVV